MRKIIILLALLFLIMMDQLSKFWIVDHLTIGEIQQFFPPIFSLTYVRNYGAAFSILQNQQWFFFLITLAVIGGAVYYLIKYLKASVWLLTALILIIAGGLGNFIDRIRLGYVVDMIHLDFMDFAIFNLADAYLSIGVVILIIVFWKEEKDGSYH
ncbi:signal peptidase II [Streptococcus dentapri]|uniref:Lipoprotein signal peptidase n=1 Tax=Streptococcus dentapri TaxID=573564 RepID=A0ABV8D0I7_9STRE